MTLYDEICEKNQICLPIDTICGINASIHFSHTACRQIITVLINSDWDDNLYFKELKNQEELELFLDNIPNLKFSKMDSCLFIDETELKSNAYKKILDRMPICPNVKLNIQECSVCLELTNKRTNCMHYLCYVCESNLVSKQCPICRRKLIQCEHCDGHHSEEEDE